MKWNRRSTRRGKRYKEKRESEKEERDRENEREEEEKGMFPFDFFEDVNMSCISLLLF